jgi:hypothetical protein
MIRRVDTWKAFRCAATGNVDRYCPVELGDWRIEKQTVGHRDADFEKLRTSIGQSSGGRCVPSGAYTGLKHRRRGLVMSNTPDEINDLSMLCARSVGRVLVNGLGLGCAVWGLLAMERVEHVDVVEIDEDVLRLVSPYFAGQRVTFHRDDALSVQWPRGTRWGAVWHDIWDTICTDDLTDHTKLKRRYAKRCLWQGAWSEDRLKYLKSIGQ